VSPQGHALLDAYLTSASERRVEGIGGDLISNGDRSSPGRHWLRRFRSGDSIRAVVLTS